MKSFKVFLLSLVFIGSSTIVLSQAPTDPVWGVYASGVGEPLKQGMDPCWITYTVGLMNNTKIQNNIEHGLMGVLRENLNWYEATELQRRHSRYFEDRPDGRYKLTPCEYPDLSGKWICEVNCPAGGAGNEANIKQSGLSITFINEGGEVSKGRFLSRNAVIAGPNWFEIRGTIEAGGQRISWSNGTVWVRK
jgi:hypothetical protein